jgi:5-methylcytosine-specific restriction enzyme A
MTGFTTEYLIQLIREDKLLKFYKSRQWLDLRAEALARDNHECQRCKKQGKYHKAECVHHIKEVKPYPWLALTLDNLMSLCNACHNQVHDRVAIKRKQPKFVNEERW